MFSVATPADRIIIKKQTEFRTSNKTENIKKQGELTLKFNIKAKAMIAQMVP